MIDPNERKKYIGTFVCATGKNKQIFGTITDLIEDEENPKQIWFIVSDKDASVGENKFSRWDKNQLQKVIVSTKLLPLD